MRPGGGAADPPEEGPGPQVYITLGTITEDYAFFFTFRAWVLLELRMTPTSET